MGKVEYTIGLNKNNESVKVGQKFIFEKDMPEITKVSNLQSFACSYFEIFKDGEYFKHMIMNLLKKKILTIEMLEYCKSSTLNQPFKAVLIKILN